MAMLYWSLRIVDKSLVIPDWAQLPLSADLSFHAIPPVLLVVDFLLLSPPWNISTTSAFGLSSMLALMYWPWVQKCFEHNGFYPYPIFGMFGLYGRIGLFILSAVTMTVNTMALKWVYGMVNGYEAEGIVDGNRGKALDESSLPEAVDGFVREGASYIGRGNMGK